MTQEEFEQELARSRAKHIQLLDEEAAAKERNVAAIDLYTKFLEGQSRPDAARFEYRRQRADQAAEYQPVSPGDGWELWSWHESEHQTVYMWRRRLVDGPSANQGGDQ